MGIMGYLLQIFFKRISIKNGQYQSFYGVGAHHHNAKYDRAIKNTMNMAGKFMVHI